MKTSFLAVLLLLRLPIFALAAPAATTSPETSPIFHALDDADLEKARAIIAADPQAVNARNGHGFTPLVVIANATPKMPYDPIAIMRERIREADDTNMPIPLVAQLLVEKGADINAKDDQGNTPLIYALYQKKTSLVRWLLDRGADFNQANKAGGTPLACACAKGEDVGKASQQVESSGKSWKEPENQALTTRRFSGCGWVFDHGEG